LQPLASGEDHLRRLFAAPDHDERPEEMLRWASSRLLEARSYTLDEVLFYLLEH
jgi:hypothetical protein